MSRLEIQSRKFPQKSNFSKNTCRVSYPEYLRLNMISLLSFQFSVLCFCVLFVLDLCLVCAECCQCLLIAHSWSPLRFFSNIYSLFTSMVGPSWSWSYGSWIYYYQLQSVPITTEWCCEFESRSGRGVQHYVIKFVSDLRQVSGFLHNWPPRYNWNIVVNKLLLNTIKQTSMVYFDRRM